MKLPHVASSVLNKLEKGRKREDEDGGWGNETGRATTFEKGREEGEERAKRDLFY